MEASSNAPLDGAWLIDKPAGLSSFGVIEEIRRAMMAREGLRKRDLPALGHGGTLDPFATGLLVVFVGKATKLSQCYLGGDKTYQGTIQFGATTASGDLTDPVTAETPHLPASLESIQDAARHFVGIEYAQTPPMHSAKKVDGKRLYVLAHQGKEIERTPRLCRIERFEITVFDDTCCSFEVTVSSGTYIRVLAQDVARQLGSLAYLKSLKRTKSSSLLLQDSISLDSLCGSIREHGFTHACDKGFVSWDHLLPDAAHVIATEVELKELFQGRPRVLMSLAPRVVKTSSPKSGAHAPCWVAIRSDGKLYGLGRMDGELLRVDRLFPRV